MTPREELLAVLADARALVAREGNDFSWSSWHDAPDALDELDTLVAALNDGRFPAASLEVLFLPTGPMQELSLSSGWGDAFIAVADRFDAAMRRMRA